MESSRRDLLNEVAEHRVILKNNQNTYPRFSLTPKTGIKLPKGVSFLLLMYSHTYTSWLMSFVTMRFFFTLSFIIHTELFYTPTRFTLL